MRKSCFADEQIITILKEIEAGLSIVEPCFKHNVWKQVLAKTEPTHPVARQLILAHGLNCRSVRCSRSHVIPCDATGIKPTPQLYWSK